MEGMVGLDDTVGHSTVWVHHIRYQFFETVVVHGLKTGGDTALDYGQLVRVELSVNEDIYRLVVRFILDGFHNLRIIYDASGLRVII